MRVLHACTSLWHLRWAPQLLTAVSLAIRNFHVSEMELLFHSPGLVSSSFSLTHFSKRHHPFCCLIQKRGYDSFLSSFPSVPKEHPTGKGCRRCLQKRSESDHGTPLFPALQWLSVVNAIVSSTGFYSHHCIPTTDFCTCSKSSCWPLEEFILFPLPEDLCS